MKKKSVKSRESAYEPDALLPRGLVVENLLRRLGDSERLQLGRELLALEGGPARPGATEARRDLFAGGMRLEAWPIRPCELMNETGGDGRKGKS